MRNWIENRVIELYLQGFEVAKISKIVGYSELVVSTEIEIFNFRKKKKIYYEVTEEDLIRGYVPPNPEHLKGWERLQFESKFMCVS
jgi:hypothetical protein